MMGAGRLGTRPGETSSHLYYFIPAERPSITTRATSPKGVTLVLSHPGWCAHVTSCRWGIWRRPGRIGWPIQSRRVW